MKKRNLLIAILTWLCVCLMSVMFFCSCSNSTQEETGIFFNTFTVDGTKVYGEVSNETTEFSFVEEVQVKGDTAYIVDNDKDCGSPLYSKIVNLEVGNNTFYVLEIIGNDIKLFTVVIRRRPMYNVSFNTNGGTEIEDQTVEEGNFAKIPEATKLGYTFICWDYDFMNPITQDTQITANWKAKTDTKYTVNYYLQNFDDKQFVLHESVELKGETDTTVNAEIKEYEHFTYRESGSTKSGNIHADGSLVLNMYYMDNCFLKSIAVMVLIDSSGSMGSGEGSNLDRAIEGAMACLEGLTSFDYCGVATFQDKYDEALKVTPVSKRKEIRDAIEDLSNESSGGTVFQAAIEGAGAALSAVDAERRHIILVSDGMPSDTGKYEPFIDSNYAKGITMSIVCIGMNESSAAKMQEDAKRGGGKCYEVFDSSKLATIMLNDLWGILESLKSDDDYHGSQLTEKSSSGLLCTATLYASNHDGINSIGDGVFYSCVKISNMYHQDALNDWSKNVMDFYNSGFVWGRRYYSGKIKMIDITQ